MEQQLAEVGDGPAVQPARVDTLFAIEYQISRLLPYGTLAAFFATPLAPFAALSVPLLLLAMPAVRWTARKRLATLVRKRHPSAVATAVYADEPPLRNNTNFGAELAAMCDRRSEFAIEGGDPLVQRLVIRRLARLRCTFAAAPNARETAGMLMGLLPTPEQGLDCTALSAVAARNRFHVVYRRASELLGPGFASEIAPVLTDARSESTITAVRALASAYPDVRHQAVRALSSLPAKELEILTAAVRSNYTLGVPGSTGGRAYIAKVALLVLILPLWWLAIGVAIRENRPVQRLNQKFPDGGWLAVQWPTFTGFLADGSSLDQLPVLIGLLPAALRGEAAGPAVLAEAARRGAARLLPDVTAEHASLIGSRERAVLRRHVADAAKAAAKTGAMTIIPAEIAEYLMGCASALAEIGDIAALSSLESLGFSLRNTSTLSELLAAVDRAISVLGGLRQTGTLLRAASPVQEGNLLVPSAPSAAGAPVHLLHTVEEEEQGENQAVGT